MEISSYRLGDLYYSLISLEDQQILAHEHPETIGADYALSKSKGLGDTIAKITHFFGIDILAKKVAKLLGKEDCGCERRRTTLNKKVPYKNKK